MPQRSKIPLQVNGEFSAAELEEIIRELAVARAGMDPPVPLDPPSEGAEGDVLEQQQAQFSIRTRADGGLRIWLRSEGIGWMAFTLSAAARKDLLAFLGKEVSHTHTSH